MDGQLDDSVLHSVARQLWDQTALLPVKVGRELGEGHLFLPLMDDGQSPAELVGRSVRGGGYCQVAANGQTICNLSFVVETMSMTDIKLNWKDHKGYAWLTEAEVLQERFGVGATEFKFTTKMHKAQILAAFRRFGGDDDGSVKEPIDNSVPLVRM